ncbi:MAG: thiamine phosphate synthase [Longimicrobiales bacterium]
MSARPLARLHLVTDDDVLRAPGFAETAAGLLERYGDAIALQLRGHGMPGRALYELACVLAPLGTVLVNDRLDVAVTADAAGAQVGRRSIPIGLARRLLGPGRWIGFSAHDRDEAAAAIAAGSDFVMAGAIYATASHPDRAPRGPDLLGEVAGACGGAPILAIGGITTARAADALAAGADGIAVLSGVWRAADATDAVAAYFRAAPQLQSVMEAS